MLCSDMGCVKGNKKIMQNYFFKKDNENRNRQLQTKSTDLCAKSADTVVQNKRSPMQNEVRYISHKNYPN